MKSFFNYKSFPFLLAVLFFSTNSLSAQIGSDVCSTYSIVAQSCVGECGNPGVLEYQTTICDAKIEDMCVSNIGSSLCPTHRAFAFIWADGNLVERGEITSVGSSVSFSVPCGSRVRVEVHAYDLVTGINCVRLGELNFALRR